MGVIFEENINIAVVGCGAIVEQQHLPSLVSRDDCRVIALVEQNQTRAEQLAQRFEVPKVYADYHELLDSEVNAVIVGLPNHLHAPVGIELLEAGLHVLVEKPMGLSVAECEAMLAAAETGQAILAVGHMRRFSHAGRFAKWILENDFLGRIISFDIQNGFASDWPAQTDYLIRKEMAGGGVLMDLGVHTLDQLLWWLGDIEAFTYYDDNYGGIEAECQLHLTLKSGAEGIVELSRTRDLRETAIIRGERAELEVALVRNFVSLRSPDGILSLAGQAAPGGELPFADQRVADLIAAEHEDFLAAVKTGGPIMVPGTEAMRSIALIEACYAERRQLRLPWVELSSIAPIAEKSS
jgi:predicted dehydrogenase